MARRWPQPHEGITGTDRDDWLLDLDERALPHREALIAMAVHLRTATLVSQPAPVVRRIRQRMTAPQPGDLVVVEDMVYSRDPDTRLKGLGIYLAARHEWMSTDAEWEKFCAEEREINPDEITSPYTTSLDNRTTDDVFYVQYGSSARDVCRWVNARCVVLPVQVTGFDVPGGYRDGNATVFTRDTLAGALADSGFELRRPEPGDG